MKTKLRFVVFAILFMLVGSVTTAAEPIETPATHAILIDVTTGTLLLDKHADVKMPTSSMSKTMTLYMVFDLLKQGKIKLTDEFHVSEKAWRMQGSKMFVPVGGNVKVEDLIRGVAIQSGNDATIVLAEGAAGTEEAMVERMNIKAKELGMNNSHFMNVSGWPHDEHYSTARDLAILAQRLIADFPDYYHYFAEKDFVYNKIKQANRDPLLGRVPGADGIKTGHTDIAGYGLIGSAIRDGRRLILVVNGFTSEKMRQEESAKLMEWGFRNFENRQLFKEGDKVDSAPVWLGKADEVSLVAEKGVTAVLPIAKRSELKLTVRYTSPIQAPIKKGTPVGKLQVSVPEQAPFEVNLLAGEDVERKGLFGRVAARLKYLLSGRDP